MASLRAIVRGRVQGVFFRAFTQQMAQRLGLTGYVRNCEDGCVEVQAEGKREKLDKFLGYLRKGPPNARVDKIDIEWTDESGQYIEFTIEY